MQSDSSYISVFDILKIGVGPSSSHTLGPWRASLKFIEILKQKSCFDKLKHIKVILYGSLSLTGKGHATEKAVMLGLCGFNPETIPVEDIKTIISEISESSSIVINGEKKIDFNPSSDIEFSKDFLPFHSNGLTFIASLTDGNALAETFYSIGGGFIVQEQNEEGRKDGKNIKIPYNITTGEDINRYLAEKPNFKIYDFAKANEVAILGSLEEVKANTMRTFDVMFDSIFWGIKTDGFLEGGLNVKRRAPEIFRNIFGKDVSFNSHCELANIFKSIQNPSFNDTLNFVSMCAMAVNETNASLGRIVTAPTNGSAGVIPAVLCYYLYVINKNHTEEDIMNFLCTSGVLGGIFKTGATISAAAGGCQAEIGVSSAMAAASLTECLGASPINAMVASEIAMEHHLGMTCDPVNGLVQIPCIERNSMGAIKAINASTLAMHTNPSEVKVSLDNVVKTMSQTAQDMGFKYKETSQGGLAIVVK
jgi:L-serine dehydratase